MSEAVTLSIGRPCGVARTCRMLSAPRSSVYAARMRRTNLSVLGRRGPKTPLSDAALVERIREILVASPFHGEGHRKVWARLRHEGIRTSKARALRLMREANLLSPSRVAQGPPKLHEGTIITEKPDQRWGTDLTAVQTIEEGQVSVLIAVDHCTVECVGIHAAKHATRFEALEPIRQGVKARFDSYGPGVAHGLQIRHDHGSQYTSDAFQKELAFLGIESSPGFVREPETNGCAERFIRTLKEQLLWVRVFRNAEDLRTALHAWMKVYNEQWLIERHGFKPPAQVRRDLLAKEAAA